MSLFDRWIVSREQIDDDVTTRIQSDRGHWCAPVLGTDRCYECDRVLTEDERPTIFGIPVVVNAGMPSDEIRLSSDREEVRIRFSEGAR